MAHTRKQELPTRWNFIGGREHREKLPEPIAIREEVINGQKVKVKVFDSPEPPPDTTWVPRARGRRDATE